MKIINIAAIEVEDGYIVKGDMIDVFSDTCYSNVIVENISTEGITVKSKYNESSICIPFSKIKDIQKVAQISVDTPAGEIVVHKNEDPYYPGIYVELFPEGYDTPIDLVAIENPVETVKKDISIYTYSDPFSEEWQRKDIIYRKDIEEALEETED